ncbi:uncharacterized protein [Diadema antillarum]|uniref:uncharacterized protein n=1 Tax=Diadema antillarum TaxID=105358 RepID=UPI003A89D810
MSQYTGAGNSVHGARYRLSPNEEAAILKEERDRRRKLRLKQVREQDRLFAKQLLAKAKAKKVAEVNALSEKLEEEWQAVQQEKAEALDDIYQRCLERVGDGHRAAQSQKPLDEERAETARKNSKVAKQRHLEAMMKEMTERNEKWQKENAHIISRKNALDVEKVRASHVASLPPPKRDPLADLDLQKPPVQVTRVDGFATTHYHIPAEYVERADPYEQDDARQAAEDEAERMGKEVERVETELRERHEKAALRHRHAKQKELLKQDYQQLLLELSGLQHADRRRRQAVVADIPRQVFQPPHRRLEEKTERQHQLEEAFEDMYMAHTDYAGDITLALEPRAPGLDTDLDLTPDVSHARDEEEAGDEDEVVLERPASLAGPGPGPSHWMAPGKRSSDAGSSVGAGPKPVSARAEMLKKLMGRIRGQRDDWQKQETKVPSLVASGQPSVRRPAVPTPGKPDQSTSASTEEPSTVDTQPSSYQATPPPTITPPTELSEYPIESVGSELGGSNGGKSLETGSLSGESGSTLLHPVERAAKIRHHQLSNQKRVQEDITARGKEQERQLQDLKQPFFIPWEDIPQAHPSSMLRDQGWPTDLVAGQRVVRGDQLEREGAAQSEEAGDEQQPSDVEDAYTVMSRHPQSWQDVTQESNGMVTGTQPPASQIHTTDPHPSYVSTAHGLHHEPDEQAPTSYGETDLDGASPRSRRAGGPEFLVGQGSGNTREELPKEGEQIPGDADSSADWLQRARAYQQRLLDRQRDNKESLREAHRKLQERRDRLMMNYPTVKLPTYVPYPLQDDVSGRFLHQSWDVLARTHPPFTSLEGTNPLRTGGQDVPEEEQTEGDVGAINTLLSEAEHSQEPYGARTPSQRVPLASQHTPPSDDSILHHRPPHKISSKLTSTSLKVAMSPGADVHATERTLDSPALAAAEDSVNTAEIDEKSRNGGKHISSEDTDAEGMQQRDTTRERERQEAIRSAEIALELRHQQLLEEKQHLEEKQMLQQARLMHKQQELQRQIERQQQKYQERMEALHYHQPHAKFSNEPPPELSPSIPHPESRELDLQSSMGSPEAPPSSGSPSTWHREGMDYRRMMQGQVFRPEDLQQHLPSFGELGTQSGEDDIDDRHLSPEADPSPQQTGGMMMGVLRPHELMPFLQDQFSSSTGSQGADHDQLYTTKSSGLSHSPELSQERQGLFVQSTEHSEYELSEGTIEMDSTVSPQGTTGSFNKLQGQVFRPGDLLAQLRDIQQQVGMTGSQGSSNNFEQSESAELEQGSGSFQRSILRGTYTRSSEYMSRSSVSGSSQGTMDRNSAGGPQGIYKELLKGHVFTPQDLLPHLQDLPAPEDPVYHEPPLGSSTSDQIDTSWGPLHSRPRSEADGGGSDPLHQPLARLSLSDDEAVHAASPDFTHQNVTQFQSDQLSTFSMSLPSPSALSAAAAKSRRPPPANLRQMANFSEVPPHELSTIVEMETSADERMHAYGTPTPRVMGTQHQDPRRSVGALQQGESFGATMRDGIPASGRSAIISDIQGDKSNVESGTQPSHTSLSIISGASTLIQISRPTVVGHDSDEYDDAKYFQAEYQGSKTSPQKPEGHQRDVSIAASSLSEYTIDDDSTVNHSPARTSQPPSYEHVLLNFPTREIPGSHSPSGAHTPQREEPAGESMRWKDLLKASVSGNSSSSTDREESVQEAPRTPAGGEFLPMMETGNITMATAQETSSQDLSQHPLTPTSNKTSVESLEQLLSQQTKSRTWQIQKHIAAGLNLDSSTSSDSQNNGHIPEQLPGSSSTASSSSKQSTIIGAGGRVPSVPSTSDDSPLFVPRASQQKQGQPLHPSTRSHSTDGVDRMVPPNQKQMASKEIRATGELGRGRSSDVSSIPDESLPESLSSLRDADQPTGDFSWARDAADAAIAATQEDYIRNLLSSLPHTSKPRGITLPLFSDVSLSGFSMSQDGSVADMQSPMKPVEPPAPQDDSGQHYQSEPDPALGGEEHTFPSLSDLQMETGILEEPDLTFHTTFDTTVDSTVPAQAPQRDGILESSPGSAQNLADAKEIEEGPLDFSQSSQASMSQSLLSFQRHEQEMSDGSPQTSVRLTQSEGQIRNTQETLTQTASLQEAFLQRKQAFVRASQSREQEIKVRAQSRSQEATAFAKTLQDWKRSKVKSKKKQTATMTTSLATRRVYEASSSAPAMTLKTSSDRNTVQKEMRERNLRLYSQLEEVKKQKEEKDRREAYAANRQKKKEFEQKLQEKRLKKAATTSRSKQKDK